MSLTDRCLPGFFTTSPTRRRTATSRHATGVSHSLTPYLDSASMSSDLQVPDEQAALRADIRRLGNLLGETLVRQEGPDLLELVERVRALSRRRADKGGWLAQAVDRITAEGVPPEAIADAVAHLRVRPVFTAHPTEAA